MHRSYPVTLLAMSLLIPASRLAAQSVDPSGHWEGAIQTPQMPIPFEVDLAKNNQGQFMGGFNSPAENIKGLLLDNFALNGHTIRFHVKGAPGEREFEGNVSPDGASMSGQFTQGGNLMSFNLTRTGPAKLEPAPRIEAISKELEGMWKGTASTGGELRMVLTNQPDGSSIGSIMNMDEGLEIPITSIVQKGSSVAIEIRAIHGSYTGELHGEELTGTVKQGETSLPLVFHRAAATQSSK